MRLHKTDLLILTLFALTTGCSSMNHGDPKNPKKNLHPVARYEVIATTEAPGPWDSVKGTVFFEVVNLECTPEDKFLGVHAKPQDVPIDFEMNRVDEKTWKGYFFRDSMLDEDYYGLGVCHWDSTQVAPVFTAHGEIFSSGQMVKEALKTPQTDYFKKSEYWNRALTGDSALVSSAENPEVIQHPDAFFPITVAVKEVTQ